MRKVGVPGSDVVLIGLMASGKTTIGRLLAARLGVPFVDNDDALVQRIGRTAREVDAAEGIDALHRAEARVLAAALAEPGCKVVAAAAAAVLEPGVAGLLADRTVVYLRAGARELARRVAAGRVERGGDHRPFAGQDPAVVLREQLDARDGAYRKLASMVVDTGTAAPETVAAAISSALAGPAPRTTPAPRSAAPGTP